MGLKTLIFVEIAGIQQKCIFVAVFRRNTGREVGQEREARPFRLGARSATFSVRSAKRDLFG